MIERYRIKVQGIVQGVFFRKFTQLAAQNLKIIGWVRNEPDDSVLIDAQGESSSINKFIEWCHTGPENALVRSVNVEELEVENKYDDFIILK